MTDPVSLDPVAITWGLFVKLEAIEEAGKPLPDPEVDSFLEAAESELGPDEMLSGWACVAAYLRKRLIEHAETLGCDCGSLPWLKREQIHLASREDL